MSTSHQFTTGEILTFIAIGVLCLLVPICIFVGRNNVRSVRSQLVDDLARLFSFAREKGGTPLIVPAFELIKYKYDTSKDAIPAGSWFIPVAIFVILSTLGFITAFADFKLFFDENAQNGLVHMGTKNAEARLMIATLGFAFLGGYTWSIQYLIRRVANFDLRPLSFLRCSMHILLGSFVTAAAWHATGLVGESHSNVAAALAFLVGLYPTLMLDKLMARFSYLQLRRVRPETADLCEEIPLDTVLGIDPYIKFRLAEFEIEDIQNLATSNPIALFVETPYGLYEAIDWIAQAHLILAVGTAKTKQLREMNIRTVFDLEKAVFNPSVRRILIRILLPQLSQEEANAIADNTGYVSATWTDGCMQRGTSELPLDHRDALQAVVSIIRDDPHVMRLRQIWDVIRLRLEQRPDPVEKAG